MAIFYVSVSFTVSPHSVNSSCVLARQLWRSGNHVQQQSPQTSCINNVKSPEPRQTTEKKRSFLQRFQQEARETSGNKRRGDSRPHVDCRGSSWKTLWLVGVVK